MSGIKLIFSIKTAEEYNILKHDENTNTNKYSGEGDLQFLWLAIE